MALSTTYLKSDHNPHQAQYVARAMSAASRPVSHPASLTGPAGLAQSEADKQTQAVLRDDRGLGVTSVGRDSGSSPGGPASPVRRYEGDPFALVLGRGSTPVACGRRGVSRWWHVDRTDCPDHGIRQARGAASVPEPPVGDPAGPVRGDRRSAGSGRARLRGCSRALALRRRR